MNRIANISDGFSAWEDALGWAAGLGFTLLLFFGLARLENVAPDNPVAPIVDLRAVSLPLDPPPPPRTDPAPPPPPTEPIVALTGIELAASDSPVHIAVVPPDLEALVPATREPPGALVGFGYLNTDPRPRPDLDTDIHRIYQVSEVDQRPQALVRVPPPVPAVVFGGKQSLRVDLLVVIDADGHVISARVLQTSGTPAFDRIVAETLRESWEFSPAVRRGKRVKCLAEQLIRVTLGGGSHFEAQ